MTASMTSAVSRREAVDVVLDRLGRLHASTATLRTAAADVRADGNQNTLNDVLHDLERDLRLASREIASVRREFSAPPRASDARTSASCVTTNADQVPARQQRP
jgi:hypothetical protein